MSDYARVGFGCMGGIALELLRILAFERLNDALPPLSSTQFIVVFSISVILGGVSPLVWEEDKRWKFLPRNVGARDAGFHRRRATCLTRIQRYRFLDPHLQCTSTATGP